MKDTIRKAKLPERVLYARIIQTWDAIIRHEGLNSNDYHMVRVESPSSPGVPDINCCLTGNEFWIEAKVAPNGLGPYQRAWKKKRELAGGIVYVLTYIDNNLIMVIDDKYKSMMYSSLAEALLYIFKKERPDE